MRVELINFGANVRKTRQNRKISQEALAELCDLHRTYICDIERGTRNVSLLSVVKIAKGLGMTSSELMMNVEFDGKSALESFKNGGHSLVCRDQSAR